MDSVYCEYSQMAILDSYRKEICKKNPFSKRIFVFDEKLDFAAVFINVQ